jgi:hypothetical protein
VPEAKSALKYVCIIVGVYTSLVGMGLRLSALIFFDSGIMVVSGIGPGCSSHSVKVSGPPA